MMWNLLFSNGLPRFGRFERLHECTFPLKSRLIFSRSPPIVFATPKVLEYQRYLQKSATTKAFNQKTFYFSIKKSHVNQTLCFKNSSFHYFEMVASHCWYHSINIIIVKKLHFVLLRLLSKFL